MALSKEFKKYFSDSEITNARQADRIEFKNIGKIYSEDGFKAINKFNLIIEPGEFVTLLGPSGCGKTTILRMIAGLEDITDGLIQFNGLTINKAEPRERNLSLVFQNYALYTFKNVYKNISFGLKNNARKNSAYLNWKNELKKKINPFYNELIELKAEKRLLVKSPLSFKDNKLALKRDLKISKILGNKDEILKIKKKINDLINNEKNRIKKNGENAKKVYKRILEIRKKRNKYFAKNFSKTFKELFLGIMLLLKLRRVWINNIPNKIEEVTKLLGINQYLQRKPSELSGGQKQRVALARAISKTVGTFLYDEPLSNLDAKLRVKMRSEIRSLHDKLKATSVYVTHDQVEAMSISDKIVIMNKGYIQQVDKPFNIISNPSNIFVARFIGGSEINLKYGKWSKEGNIIFNNSKIKVAKRDFFEKISDKKEIIFGIRPSDFIVDPFVLDSNKKDVYVANVEYLELLGAEYLVKVNHKILGILSILVHTTHDIKRGSEISFMFKKDKIHIFDKDSGWSMSSKLNSQTELAKKTWNDGLEERRKNQIILRKARFKMKITEKIRLYLLSLFINSYKNKVIEMRKKEIPYSEDIKID